MERVLAVKGRSSGEGGLWGWGMPWQTCRECGLTLMLTDPSSLDSSPRRAESREDFPAPTGPTTASRQPWGTVRFILATQEVGMRPWVGPSLSLQNG